MRARTTVVSRFAMVLTAALLGGCGSPASTTPALTSGAPSSTPSASPTVATAPSPTALATPAITGLTGHVVYARAGGDYGDETTFVVNIDGSNEHQIGEKGLSGFPWATPDGKRIIVGMEVNARLGAKLYDLDGGNELTVPEPADLMFGSAPMTSDGKLAVAETFTSPGFAFQATNVVTIATGKMRKLVADPHYISGDISPDDRQVLLFLNNPDVDPPAPGSLWVIGLDGAGLRRVTPPGTGVQCCMNYRWSPDGKTILFAGPEGSIWTVGIDGSNLTELFHQDGKWAITPTYSLDGSMIMFGLDPAPNPFAHPVNGLYVIRADGSDLTLAIGGDFFKREPIWLP